MSVKTTACIQSAIFKVASSATVMSCTDNVIKGMYDDDKCHGIIHSASKCWKSSYAQLLLWLTDHRAASAGQEAVQLLALPQSRH
jgi:hypothetical protein